MLNNAILESVISELNAHADEHLGKLKRQEITSDELLKDHADSVAILTSPVLMEFFARATSPLALAVLRCDVNLVWSIVSVFFLLGIKYAEREREARELEKMVCGTQKSDSN